MTISLKQQVSIIGIGSLSTLLFLLMLELFFAQILTSTILSSINNNLALLIIIIGLFLFTIIIAFIVGYFVTPNIALKSVRNASFLSIACLFLFLFVVCNVLLYLNYSDIYRNIYGFEILWIFPQVLVYFSIYILEDVFNLFIFTIIVYYLFFVLFLDNLYIKKVGV